MEFSGNYFVEEKPVDQVHGSMDRAARSTMARQPLPRTGAHRSSAPSRSGAREVRPRGRGGEGRAGEFNDGVTVGREAVEGRLTSGGASARKGIDEGMVRAKRRSTRGVGVFTEGGQPFIGQRRGGGGWVPPMAGVDGASMPPD
jgi:hypothetical protein